MNPFTNPDRPPAPGYVALRCEAHGAFVAWCSPPAPSAPVWCPAACSAPADDPDYAMCRQYGRPFVATPDGAA